MRSVWSTVNALAHVEADYSFFSCMTVSCRREAAQQEAGHKDSVDGTDM